MIVVPGKISDYFTVMLRFLLFCQALFDLTFRPERALRKCVIIGQICSLFLGFSVSTVAEEKQFNPRFTRSKEGFVQFMKELNLAYPKLIGEIMLLQL